MKRYTTGQARQRLAEVLDTAERGQAVLIERRGVRFVVTAEKSAPRRPRRRRSIIAHLDPAVASGQWTWAREAGGLRFTPRRRPRR